MVREIEGGSKRDRQKERRETRLKRKVEIGVGETGAKLSPKQNDLALLQALDTPLIVEDQTSGHSKNMLQWPG